MGDMGFEAITFIWAFTTIRSATTHNNSIKKYKRLRLKQIYIYIYNSISFLENVFSRIENFFITFSNIDKIFLKRDLLMYALRHTLTRSIYIYIYI